MIFDKLYGRQRDIMQLIYNVSTEEAIININKYMDNNNLKDRDLGSDLDGLKEMGYLEFSWGMRYSLFNFQVTPKGRSYFEMEKDFEKLQNNRVSNQYNVGTINATGSNVTFGDVISSTQSIDNSVQSIEKRIDEMGAEDKEALKELLEEAKEIAENIKETKSIHTNNGFIKRLGKHFEKHNWFYSSILELFGNTVIGTLQNK
ncbi:hypothetical protein [Clostridium manihotivorum]|uniref:Uncharacterized protein n=1 Tax=Clostridium manihotivorum TaxID=2320868 RepID=A0A3R5X2C2_9CLOT|nr:hypothetical protein [Clostridium manihotivorum]QAA32761.1 hypothetical protein C1I91_14560 [Clostridium manihotivorum]